MMKNVSFFAALVTASGAAGTVSLFFSYAGGDTFLWAMAAFVLVLAGSFLLAALPEKKRFPLTALLFVCLAAVLHPFPFHFERQFHRLFRSPLHHPEGAL